MSDPAPAVPVPKAAPVPAVSLAAALQMEGFWANARLQSMALEKQMLEMNKDRVKRAMDVMADLGKTRDEVGQHQDQFRCQTAKNEEIRKDIESLRGQKAILEKSTCSTRQISDMSPEMVLSLDCPCFRVLTRTIDGGARGFGVSFNGERDGLGGGLPRRRIFLRQRVASTQQLRLVSRLGHQRLALASR